ncbi:MAG: hypothetical protein LBP73_00235 [Clostridiales Family XIII bacterium]|jgi:hypothetical protein|nr:hypothetical protein [Clostridiales Family XIII bacterium]
MCGWLIGNVFGGLAVVAGALLVAAAFSVAAPLLTDGKVTPGQILKTDAPHLNAELAARLATKEGGPDYAKRLDAMGLLSENGNAGRGAAGAIDASAISGGLARRGNVSPNKPVSPIDDSKTARVTGTRKESVADWYKERNSIAKDVEKRFTPMDKGPLPDAIANTFRSGTYNEIILQEETVFYREYGGKANEIGSYWTTIKPQCSLQAIIDSALDINWGNTATNVATIKVPRNTTIYQGYVERQGNLVGGGVQVYIPEVNPIWLVK